MSRNVKCINCTYLTDTHCCSKNLVRTWARLGLCNTVVNMLKTCSGYGLKAKCRCQRGCRTDQVIEGPTSVEATRAFFRHLDRAETSRRELVG